MVSSSDILTDMIADSIVGQYWSDLWDHDVDSVNAMEGLLQDTAEELANDEDVLGFIRDYMNGFIGADVPCKFFGVAGTGCRGVEEMLFGVFKGTANMLGHPCQTEENIADALIIAGEATEYFIEDPPKATKNAVSSVSGWWNDKNTYEKIRTVVEAYIMYRMIASGGSKGKTVTLESEEAAGTIAGEAGEIAEEAAKAGEAGAEVAEDAAKAGGKGKVKIESGGNSLGIVNGKTPASRFADKLRGLSNSKRPNTVAVVRTADGKYYVGYNKAGIYNNNIQKVLDYLGNKNLYNRQCAEVNAISRAFNDRADLRGATISVANVRKASDVSGVHGTYKPPCDVCQPLIDFFGIEVIN